MADEPTQDSFNDDDWSLDDDVSLLDEAAVQKQARKKEPEPEPEDLEPVDSGMLPPTLTINLSVIDSDWERIATMGDEFFDEEEAEQAAAAARAREEQQAQEEESADSGMLPPQEELAFNVSWADANANVFTSMGEEGWGEIVEEEGPSRAEQKKIDEEAQAEEMEQAAQEQYAAMFPDPPAFRIQIIESQVHLFRHMGEEGDPDAGDEPAPTPRRAAAPEPPPDEPVDSGIIPPVEAVVMQLSLESLPRMMKLLGEESQPDD